jgi:DNA-binding beta-propeller fold protein YncE
MRSFPRIIFTRMTMKSVYSKHLQNLWILASVVVGASAIATPASALNITRLSSTGTDANPFGAEIPAYDPATRRLFVVSPNNRLDVIDISNPSSPLILPSIDLSLYGGGVNSVAVKNGIVAAAVEANPKTTNGQVVFFDTSGFFQRQVTVGALPDMLTFSPDGTKVLVANEGEPNSYGEPDSVDPEGSISIIDVLTGNVQTADFTGFNGQIQTLRNSGVRIFGPGATVAQDLEPEYIALSSDGATAWVTLQENNAVAIVDVATARVTQILPLGLKDHSLPGNRLDASDRDNAINIQNWPVFGMYQPDTIASFNIGGQTYYITANEGDARDYDGFSEEARVRDLPLDPTIFPNADSLRANANLGRLTVTTATGDTDGDGDFDRLDVFGSRSFSIWSASGSLLFDSGDQLEQRTASLTPAVFNSNGASDTFDTRSDNKGPEPEGLAVGQVGNRRYSFIGLERTGGFMAYDITNPLNPVFTNYVNDVSLVDRAPEGLLFIPAAESPNGIPLLVVANEVSRNVAIYSVESVPEPSAVLGLVALGLVGYGLKKRRSR